MLILFGRGRNFSGMEFHVFRPIMTTFFLSVTKIWSFYKTFTYTEIPGWEGKSDSKYDGFIRIHFIGHLPACAPKHLVGNLTGISDHTCTFLSNKIRTYFNIITPHLFNPPPPPKKIAISSKSLSSLQFCYFSNLGNLLLWLFYFGYGKIKMTNKLKQTWRLTVNCDCLRLMRSAWSFT